MTRRATEVARIDLRGDESTATKYIPYGRVLLARAIAKLNSDGRKVGIERGALEGDRIRIQATATYAGNVITIWAGLDESCCTYSDDLLDDPNLDDEDSSEEFANDAFGGGAWGDFQCGDHINPDEGYYTTTVLDEVNFDEWTQDSKPFWNPCPDDGDDDGWYSGLIGMWYCNSVAREWTLNQTEYRGGNFGEILLGVCDDNTPIILRFNVDVEENYKYYEWAQFQYYTDELTTGFSFAVHGPGSSCTDRYHNGFTHFYDDYSFRRWWTIKKRQNFREAHLTIDVVFGGSQFNLVNIKVFRDNWYEYVDMAYDPYPDGYDCCSGQSYGCPPALSLKEVIPVSGDALHDTFNKNKDVITYIPLNTQTIEGCEDLGMKNPGGEEEGDESGDEETFKQTSENGCVRCVVYRGNELVCTGPWIDPDTGGVCVDPGAEPVASSDDETAEEPEEEPAEEEVELPDEPTPDGDGDSIVNSDINDFATPAQGIDETQNRDKASIELEKLYGRYMEDFNESYVEGPPQGVYKEWVKELLTRPVSYFETWTPPNIIKIVTGGKTCRNS